MDILEMEVKLIKAHETMRIRINIQFEVVNDLGCDPPGTKFGSRKAGAIENKHIDTRLSELPGAG